MQVVTGPWLDSIVFGERLAIDGKEWLQAFGGTRLLVADTMCVRRVTLDGEVSPVTARDFWIEAHGEGEFGFLGGIAVDKNGDIFLTDTSLHALLIVDRDGQVSVLAGGNGAGFSDGWGRSASFDKPRGLAVDPSGRIFIADSNNHAVRVLLPNGKVDSMAPWNERL